MKLCVFEAIDVPMLVDSLNVSPIRKLNLKQKVYYLLSLLTDTNDTYRLNSSNNGYHNLCSSELKKVMGNRDFYIIRALLLNPDDPIIEVDNSWYNPNNTSSSGYCQGYRITPKYRTGQIVHKSLKGRFAKLVTKNQEKKTEDSEIKPDYLFLMEQFQIHSLKLDKRVYQYVRNFGEQLLKRVQNNNHYQKMLIFNQIGRWIYHINEIEAGNIWKKVSNKNHRLNSSITNLSRMLRPFLLCDDKPLTCVDVSSSQPYILSSLMKSSFYYEQNSGYNLMTIYPELYNELVKNGDINNSRTYNINYDTSYYSNHTRVASKPYSINTNMSSSFMWCSFFSATEMESLNRYIDSPFYGDFYTHILDRFYTYNNSYLKHVSSEDRIKLKNTMMYVLFDDNMNHRNNNSQIQIFQSVFPGVEKWINQIHKIIGKKRFSYLLQRTESYLLLAIICKEFNFMYPDAPLFTIHDGIFTSKNYEKKLLGYVINRLNQITGIIAGCKTKSSQIDPNPQIKDIDNEWSKIEPIDTEEKYLKNINGVFTSNISRGSEFLKNFGRNFLNGIEDQI